jgi:chromosome segregation ATPase
MASANVQNTPSRVKEKILEFLESRGGILRSGQNYVWEVLYWKCYRKGEGSSNHFDIKAMKQYITELEADGKIMLERNGKGICNCIALPSVNGLSNDLDETSNDLTNSELAELFSNMSAEYSRMEEKLEKATKDVEDSVHLAAQCEEEANTAREEKEAAESKLNEALAELAELREKANFSGVREILIKQEEELAEVRKDNRMLELDIAEKSSEIRRMTAEVQRATSNLESIERAKASVEKKYSKLSSEIKSERKNTAEEIKNLKNELKKHEKGEGLTAAKSVAVMMYYIEDILQRCSENAHGVLMDYSKRYILQEHYETFERNVEEAYNKIAKRAEQ